MKGLAMYGWIMIDPLTIDKHNKNTYNLHRTSLAIKMVGRRRRDQQG
jgi:hypothetical protein